jgi:cobalt-zinc-cadmium efflux system membrane fusion protein
MKTIYFLPLAVVLFFSCNKNAVEAPQPDNKSDNISLSEDQLKNISVDTAKSVPEEEFLSLTGKVSFDESKVGKVFPLVGGNVIRVAVALGDYVQKGQLLAVIRSTEISDLQSQYVVAQNNVDIAKKNLDIADALYKTNVNSETQELAAKNEYARAQSEANRLLQALSVYGANPKSTDGTYTVLSPIEGYVVEKNINEDMEIRSDNGTNIFTVSSLNTVWVLADVYESDLAKITTGDEVEVSTLSYGDKIFKGQISQVGNLLDPETKTMKIRIVLDNKDGLLKPEMFALVKVHVAHPKKSVLIPSASVIFDNNKYFVMVRKGKTEFEKREVIPGPVVGKNTFIKKGIDQGEVLVTEGSLLVESNKF